MSAIWRGLTLVEQPAKETFSSTAGIRRYLTFKGTQSEIQDTYDYYVGLGATCEITEGGEGGVWTLTVDVAGEDPEYSWEITMEAKSQDVLTTDLFFGLTSDERMTINDYFDNFKGGKITEWPKIIDPDTLDETPLSALGKKAFLLKLRGLNDITLFVPVLKSKYVVTRDYEILDAISNVEKIHSKATMISVESVPLRLWGALQDSSTETYTETFTEQTCSVTYNKGYQKGPPQVTAAGNGKILVEQEYRFAAYAVDVYGAMI